MATHQRRTRFTMHAFEHQSAALTLRQGIAEYHAANPGLVTGRGLSAEAQEFFRCHDAVHVLFGCSTALDDEAVVKIASMLGTTAGLSVLKGYRLHESIQIYKKLRVADVLRAITRSVLVLPPTIVRCRRQHRRWPWSDFDAHLDRPLRDIRAEFGIVVAHRTTGEVAGRDTGAPKSKWKVW